MSTTIKQRLAFERIVENRGNFSLAMKQAGYSAATAKNPRNLTKSKGWEELLKALVSDEVVVKRVYEILAQDDKRASLQAADMLFKLKDRYPANKLKVQQYDQELAELAE